jgi:glycosyltransferase involved in cell wall biosynthesis
MVSVIIPMYNAQDSIIKCLESVVNQTYQGAIEIIVVNDGSKDQSQEMVADFARKYSNFYIKLLNQDNGGVSKARNTGLNAARGDFIALLDSDDEWLINKLEIQMNIFHTNREIDFLGCARNDEDLKIFGRKIQKLHHSSIYELLFKMHPQTSTAIFKKELFLKFGGYNENMTHAEDGELWLRYCTKSNFYYLPTSLVITGNGKPSFGHSGLSANLSKMYEGNLFILKQALDNKFINFSSYYVLLMLYKIKHLRRIIITKIRKI